MIIGLGLDFVQISRFEVLIGKWQGKIINKLFTNNEYLYCSKYKNSCQHYAGTFAVKEALIKAYGKGDIKFKDIEVLRTDNGKPAIHLHGRAKEKIDLTGTDSIHVTITHDNDYAVAAVIMESKRQEL